MNYCTLLVLLFSQIVAFSQSTNLSCLHEVMMKRQLESNPNAVIELNETEKELQEIVQRLKTLKAKKSSYVIPVVMHVFHNGEDGKMDMDQALAGLEILNEDFNGLNDGWNTIESAFDSIKGTLDITFCLATIDPQGNPTTGLIYYEDAQAMNNEGNLFRHAWDNYKYLNIYFPKYTGGAPSVFTAYAYYPSTSSTNNDRDGIFYSSIRWGYGNHSELEEDDDWASVCSHETGHWLNLRHTFEGGCAVGDLVDDTPPTIGGTIELEGCYNNDFSCSVPTNGSNYMDYNHRCKKMFTLGQVERMEAALYLPSRIRLWSEENLIETGCSDNFLSTQNTFRIDVSVYPNPVLDFVTIRTDAPNYNLIVFNSKGQLCESYFVESVEKEIDLRHYNNGLYLFTVSSGKEIRTGKFIVNR